MITFKCQKIVKNIFQNTHNSVSRFLTEEDYSEIRIRVYLRTYSNRFIKHLQFRKFKRFQHILNAFASKYKISKYEYL